LPLASTLVCKGLADLVKTTSRSRDSKTIEAMRPTQALFKRIRRLALTTKKARKGYYKGTGSGSTGRHTQHGGYIIEWEKVRTYVVPPNLSTFKVDIQSMKPLVSTMVVLIWEKIAYPVCHKKDATS
jgi:hypothetical protein